MVCRMVSGGAAEVMVQGFATGSKRFVVRVRGHEVAWGSSTGGQHVEEVVRGKGGSDTVGSPAAGRIVGLGADTVVSIEREVVSGHAYAVLTPETRCLGWCGYDKPTFQSVDGVFSPVTLGPRRWYSAGALVLEVCMGQPDDMLDDEDYPAFTMGRAAEIIGCTPDFLRRLGEAKLIDPFRSGGGHRRYSRYQIRLAARAREMCDQGTDMGSACRIIILEDQLEEALRHNQNQHP
jgi:hypothetical protein